MKKTKKQQKMEIKVKMGCVSKKIKEQKEKQKEMRSSGN